MQENRTFTHLYYFYASFPEKKEEKKKEGLVLEMQEKRKNKN